MTEMKPIERMARAIFNDLKGRRGLKDPILHHEGLPYEAGWEENKDWCLEVAREALLAIREPTEDMLHAGAKSEPFDLPPGERFTPGQIIAATVYHAMIDKALES